MTLEQDEFDRDVKPRLDRAYERLKAVIDEIERDEDLKPYQIFSLLGICRTRTMARAGLSEKWGQQHSELDRRTRHILKDPERIRTTNRILLGLPASGDETSNDYN